VNVNVDGRDVRVTNLERVLWPAVGVTKADLIGYYTAVAPLLLPNIAGHPVTLHRFPEGVNGPHFYQTRAPAHPPWVRTMRLRSPNDKEFDVVVVDDLPGLVWASNIGAIELHPYLGTVEDFYRPSQVVFDLDPGEPAGLAACCSVALAVRDFLDSVGIVSTAKTSGAKGIHVHVPIEEATFADTKAFANAVAELVARQMPKLVVTTMSKADRVGRVFIDWSQNDPWKSTVAPWSVRGLFVPTVAAPLAWPEVQHAAATGDITSLMTRMHEISSRLIRNGNAYTEIMRTRQRLPQR
jgi:bifunctional non-homologous end joining protein LigD